MTTLEKIRAEIDGLLNDGFGGMYDHGVFDCLQIIDKHAEREPCEDAVSRQAVLDINASHHGQMPNHINHQIWQEIKDLPSVRPQEQKTGHWISREGNGQILPFWGRYECSECGECAENNNYCPNCGAEMKGGAE